MGCTSSKSKSKRKTNAPAAAGFVVQYTNDRANQKNQGKPFVSHNVSQDKCEIQWQVSQSSPVARSTVESIQPLKPLDHIYQLGESSSGFNANFKGAPQSFEKLKQQHLSAGSLFKDPTFPASEASFHLRGRDIKWLRPREITGNPVFFSDGAERFDVCQGELGNCWLLAAVANLTLHKRHLERVVPHDQTFTQGDYAGIFHFRFWQYGKWIDVVIDDRLPTENGKLLLMHSTANHEFWSALLEKAYAKLHGSYNSLKSGQTCEAMEDLTGGLTEVFKLQSDECPPNLFTVMKKAHQRGSFMSCAILSQMNLHNGLIKKHAYSITSVKLVQTFNRKTHVKEEVQLVRLRNPWGNEAEWKGEWGDSSKIWTTLSNQQTLDHTPNADGEFWMSFADFKKFFTTLEITNLKADSLDEDTKRRWQVNYFEGQWISGLSAGGCRNNIDTFHMNPQFMIKLVDPDEEDDDDLCTCVVALMQKNHRIKRHMGHEELKIGFLIYKVKENSFEISSRNSGSQVLSTAFFRNNSPVARSTWEYRREVNGRFRLKPGCYCIVPSTFEPGQKGEFMIRIFTEKAVKNVFNTK